MASKTNLRVHVVLVTKYRKPVLDEEKMNFVIDLLRDELPKRNIQIIALQGDDCNHIHAMLELTSNHSVRLVVQLMKQLTTYHIWKKFHNDLRKTYLHNNYLWSAGYFCSTTGDASGETIKRYIENQG